MDHPKVTDSHAVIDLLVRHGIEFIVIGGAAATLHGSPQFTFDLDIVRQRTPDNIERLMRVLEELDAVTRFDSRRLRVGESHLEGKGALLLSTRLGPLDLLGALNDGRGYDDLLEHSEIFPMDGHQVYVLDLPTLIEVKLAAGRDKDKLAAGVLVAILRRREKREP